MLSGSALAYEVAVIASVLQRRDEGVVLGVDPLSLLLLCEVSRQVGIELVELA